jgi:thioredoxin reductase (NADPH)
MAGTYDVAIIGGGVAGFSAAMYCGRLKLNTLVIAESRGGTIILTNHVTNWPGTKVINGMDLATSIEEHAKEYKPEIVDAKAVKVEKAKDVFSITDSEGKEYSSKTLILATGSTGRKMGIPGEKELENKGVHSCALCDGVFYKDKTIAVIGGSDSAVKEALLLTQWAKKVYVIYRGENVRAEPINLERMKANEKIEIINNTNVKEFAGAGRLENLILDKPYKGSTEFKVDGAFVEIGRTPNSELAKQLGAKLNEKGEVIINRHAEMSVPGAYACGDVVDTVFKQAIVGAGEAVLASYCAYEFLQGKRR